MFFGPFCNCFAFNPFSWAAVEVYQELLQLQEIQRSLQHLGLEEEHVVGARVYVKNSPSSTGIELFKGISSKVVLFVLPGVCPSS